MTKSALVCGAGGFIGNHLVDRLKREGFWVRGVDLKYPEFSPTSADDDEHDPIVPPTTTRITQTKCQDQHNYDNSLVRRTVPAPVRTIP